jgi:hypothetical protein
MIMALLFTRCLPATLRLRRGTINGRCAAGGSDIERRDIGNRPHLDDYVGLG